jgi:hypothetical protein
MALAGMGAPPRGPFDGPTGPARRFATADVPFERLRMIKRVLGGTINDVVLTAVAIGLHELLASRGESTKGRSLRVLVPSPFGRRRRPETWGTASLQRSWRSRSGP